MAKSAQYDAWRSADNYDLYMGRWSRPIAARFLDWLGLPSGLDWLDVGCGTGELTAAIVRQCDPASVVAIDPSAGFVANAREKIADGRVAFRIGDASSLATLPAARLNVAVAGLAINFIPDRRRALEELKRVTRPGGTVGFYVWDYPGGGVQFMRAFWAAATALDPAARELAEDRRFPFCTPEGLADLAREAGLHPTEATAIELPSVFRDFEDYWLPFTLGAGPAPGYCVSLSTETRERLKNRLSTTLQRQDDGSIILGTRAWAIKAKVT